ncbi:related to HAT (Half-A-TPR) repeat-containing protein [Ramularia collo-cygni]|uniref:Related to HAT (Half-A-TPR) repeat-containing protein n=1 Tax=Ramularia collo-cygni TaxID=112498 RepID=A0A2D3V1U8_9PEZI|nr:related to HAT (Half-A-TPR) repeat-containing protein [Ramularia collo-cygni]CZT18647.1 related to HAT (Half-A-TPR) repeat-containing protein [Ramularia collo-cygni]
MAATTDRARFYLEQYVPELQEFSRKKIFTPAEITAITAKRSDFEHVLNARGSTPADYARYAVYESNLDSLRKKRCQRLGIKGSKTFSGQRTVFFVLDRATKKFPGDMGLWMQYIQFCQKEKANKKLARVFTSVLRLHPREYGMWVLAAKHYAEGMGDMSTARGYMQRGLRFCKDERKLYLEYVRLEMVYLAKLAARRKVLGLDERRQEKAQDEDDNMISLPTITAEDINPDAGKGIEEVDEAALKRLANAPAYTGAIPIAIFDSAMKQVKNAAEAAEEFFNLVFEFSAVPSTAVILEHILDHLRTAHPNTVETVVCEAKLALFGVDMNSADFPPALGRGLASLKSGTNAVPEKQRKRFAEKAIALLLAWGGAPDQMDEDVSTVLAASMNRYLKLAGRAKEETGAALLHKARGGDAWNQELMIEG